jgi:hypothetical protein
MESWQVIASSSVVAAIVTVAVNRLLKHWDEEAVRSATKQAIQAEIDYACEFALSYLEPGSVKSPMHRITTAFYGEGVPKLIALGAINTECAQALLQYYGNVDQMNRSLDLVQTLEDPAEKSAEIVRAMYKACSLVPISDLKKLTGVPRKNAIELKVISKKCAKYGNTSPYDRVKRAMGLV